MVSCQVTAEMAPRRTNKQAIVEVANRVIAERGVGDLTFQALADALGVTKQAVLYWYPSKAALARDLVLPALGGEVSALIAAVASATGPADGVARFARALIGYHLQNLPRFRLVYLAGQVDREVQQLMMQGEDLAEVHRITSSGYAALEACLAKGGVAEPRRTAVAVHMAGIGLITMVALGAAIEDPLSHRTEALVTSLVALLTGAAGLAPL